MCLVHDTVLHPQPPVRVARRNGVRQLYKSLDRRNVGSFQLPGRGTHETHVSPLHVRHGGGSSLLVLRLLTPAESPIAQTDPWAASLAPPTRSSGRGMPGLLE